MDTSKPVLLVDSSYATIYRYTALQHWYRLQNKDEDTATGSGFDWLANTTFMSKLQERFLGGFDKLRKTHDIPYSNFVFCLDQPRATLWRTRILPYYKANRVSSPALGQVLEIMREKWLPDLETRLGVNRLAVETMEADDVIACATRSALAAGFPKVVILTSDKDFLQLCGDRVHIENLQGKRLVCEDADAVLLAHVLLGDVADNVPKCIPRAGKKTIEKLVADRGALERLLEDPAVRECYDRNRRLIDFQHIPVELAAQTAEKFEALLAS